MYLLNLFFVFSIIGYVFETILRFLLKGNYIRGMMYGPWVPIYGLAAIAIYFINKFLFKCEYSQKTKVLLFFIFSGLSITILEFVVGNILERLTNEEYWNYEWAFLNLGKYICLEVSLAWSASATLINYCIYPKLKKLIIKIPKIASFILSFIFVVDLIFRIINEINR